MEFAALSPWTAVARRFDWRPPEGAARIEGECEIETAGTASRAPQRAPFFLVPREGARAHVIAGEPALFGGDAAAATACTLEVRLSHDGECLETVVRARAPLASPTAAGPEQGTRLVIAADGRPARRAAPDTLETGVVRLVLRPSETGVWASPEVMEGIEAAYRALPDGGEWRVRLPFAGWCVARRGPPGEIGLEIAMILANEGGDERGRVAFSGRRHGDRHPHQFPPAFLLR